MERGVGGGEKREEKQGRESKEGGRESKERKCETR